MDLPKPVLDALFDAGRGALTFNAPLSAERANHLIGCLGAHRFDSLVDFGCGTGEFARMVAAHLPGSTVTGIDTDKAAIDTARDKAIATPAHRVDFQVADASAWSETTDAAVCVGSSHAFGGGAAEMFAALALLVPTGPVIVGDSFWQSDPDAWCLETFGEMPSRLDGLTDQAIGAGWVLVEADSSTLAEWDDFEGNWVRGVRAVGTPDANAFADVRVAEYSRYRGVLGFGWLVLAR